MTEFEYLVVGVSIILGLGVSVSLTSFLYAFKSRKTSRLDWIPIVWGIYVFWIQLQFYDATWGMSDVEVWNRLEFSLPLLTVMLAFTAAGLVLPNVDDKYPSDLGEYFDQHGKWAIAILAVRPIIAFATNTMVFNEEAFGLITLFMFLQVAAAVFYLVVKRRQLRIAATVLFGLALFATMRTIYG